MNEAQALREQINKIKTAIADYMWTKGCGCCRDIEANTRHEETLGKLLGIEKYKDDSGYDFSKYRTKK